MENVETSPEPQIGDILEIVYGGDILPTQSAELTEVQSIRVIEKVVEEISNNAIKVENLISEIPTYQ